MMERVILCAPTIPRPEIICRAKKAGANSTVTPHFLCKSCEMSVIRLERSLFIGYTSVQFIISITYLFPKSVPKDFGGNKRTPWQSG